MNAFTYVSINDPGKAATALANDPHGEFLAGGTNLIDEMKLGLRMPTQLIDINHLPLMKIELAKGGGLKIGAMVRNSDLAWNGEVTKKYPVLSQALLSGASPQLRNMASTGGNLLQHTRCYYFRDKSYACNKRQPGSGCSAIDGFNRIHAILGTSDKCIATHPSDMCVALAALDATIHITGKNGDRTVPINDFYVSYGDDPARENTLQHGDLITAVELPALPWAAKSHYLKVRDRASYEFALASAAVALEVSDGAIRNARLALGGVATKPWRAREAEESLVGKPANEATFTAAAEMALRGAKPQKYNAFKVELSRRTIVQALKNCSSLA